MPINMDWSNSIECSFTSESLPKDLLNRTIFASYLTSYLAQFKESSYVFNINSVWGAGKTYFIKRWANSLDKNHPVIYFNSWKYDNNNEPLILLLSEIIKQLQSLLDSDENKNLKRSLMKSTTAVLKHIAPTLAKGVFKKVSGIDWVGLTENCKTDEDNEDAVKLGKDLAAVSTQAILNLHTEQQKSIDDLKETISEILLQVIVQENADGNRRHSPMYVFIDELDRCRPTFAIEVLEVIKHIFDVPRIIFVIATDTGQLQHSIKAVYGHDFDADKYLMRFFNRSFSLPKPGLSGYIASLGSWPSISERLEETNSYQIIALDGDYSVEVVSVIFESFGTDLRSVNQILERVSSILAAHKEETGVLILLLFECLRVKNATYYNALWEKRISAHATGKFQLAFALQELGLDDKRSCRCNKHENYKQYEDSRSSKFKINFTKNISSVSIFQYVMSEVLQEPSRVDAKSVAQLLYFSESVNGDIRRFKNYVELAANLS